MDNIQVMITFRPISVNIPINIKDNEKEPIGFKVNFILSRVRGQM